MRRFAVVLVATLFPFSLFSLATRSALADEPDAEAPPPAVAPAPAAAPAPAPVEEAPELKSFVILANPLAMAIGRYSIQAEYLPAVHHAITLNPVYTHAPVTVTVDGEEIDAGSLNGFGGELGYKFYTGRKGPNGFFVGPSFLFASYSSSQTGTADRSFTSLGFAVDIGGQGVIGPGFTIGGGFGLQWTKNSEEATRDVSSLNLASEVIAGAGLRPRFLFTIGYAF
jgi:hypothetical protein